MSVWPPSQYPRREACWKAVSRLAVRLLEDLCEAPGRCDDRLTRKAAEAEHQPGPRSRLLVHRMDRADRDATSSGRRLDRRVRSTLSKVGDEMHPLIGRVDHDVVLRSAGQLGDQGVALTPILKPRPPQVRRAWPAT